MITDVPSADIAYFCSRQDSSLTIPPLTKPLRPIFIHPGTSYAPTLPLPGSSDAPFIPIICLSASTFISHGGPEARRDPWGTFEYVQGSGDDDELWGKGLKPAHFFPHREEILSASREDLPELIQKLVEQGKETGTASVTQGLDVWREVPDGSGIWLGTNAGESPPVNVPHKVITFRQSEKPLIRQCQTPCRGSSGSGGEELVIQLQEGKKKKTDLDYATQVLPAIAEFVARTEQESRNEYEMPVYLRDWNGKSLSVGAAIWLSWTRLDERGQRRNPSIQIPTRKLSPRYDLLYVAHHTSRRPHSHKRRPSETSRVDPRC